MTIAKGALSTAVFTVVAYIGVLPSNNIIVKRRRSVKTEMSVIGCILAYCQILYFSNHFPSFFAWELDITEALGTISHCCSTS